MYARRLLAHVLLIAAAIGIVATGCGPATAPPMETAIVPSTATAVSPSPIPASPTPEKRTLRVAYNIGITSLDPQTFTDDALVMRGLMYDGLVALDSNLKVVPALAESWEVAADGVTYTFHIRSGVKFHDGTLLTAQAVKASFDRLLDPNRATAASAEGKGFIKSVDVVDPMTITLTTKMQFPLTLIRLGVDREFVIVSPHDIATYGSNTIEKPIGTGPYRFVEWVKDDHLTLERNPDYWGGSPAFDQIIIRTVPEGSARVTALLNHEEDLVQAVLPTDLDQIRADPSLQVIQGGGARKLYAYLDMSRPPFNDVRVREAVNYAVDKQSIVDNLLKGMGTPMDSVIAPMDFGYSQQDPYPFDPAKAKALLKEAAYDSNQTIRFVTPVGRFYLDQQVCEAIASMLGNVGMKVQLVPIADSAAFLDALVKGGTWEMLWNGWYPNEPDADGDLYMLYRTGQIFNSSRYSNARVDQLLDLGRSTTDESARLGDYKEAQQIIWKDAPMLFTYYQRVAGGADSHLKGVRYYYNDLLWVKWAYWQP